MKMSYLYRGVFCELMMAVASTNSFVVTFLCTHSMNVRHNDIHATSYMVYIGIEFTKVLKTLNLRKV